MRMKTRGRFFRNDRFYYISLALNQWLKIPIVLLCNCCTSISDSSGGSQFLEAESAWGRQVQGHDFESCGLFIEGLSHLVVRLLDQGSQGWHAPLLIVGGRPQSWNRWFLPYHLVLKLRRSDILDQILLKCDRQSLSNHSHITESHGQVDIFIILNEIDDCSEQCVECVLGHVLSHASASCHGHWVRVDSSEALLVDRVLADCGRDLLLSWIADQMVLDFRIDDEDWLEMMDVLPFKSLGENVHLGTNISISNLR